MKIKSTVYLLLIFFTTTAIADTAIGSKVVSYTSHDGNSHVSIVRYGNEEDQTYLVHYQNFESEWDGQSILLHKEEGLTKTSYDHLTPGRRVPKVFRSILDIGRKALVNGSIVPEIEVYAKGSSGKGIKMYLNNTPLMKPEEVLSHYNK